MDWKRNSGEEHTSHEQRHDEGGPHRQNINKPYDGTSDKDDNPRIETRMHMGPIEEHAKRRRTGSIDRALYCKKERTNGT